MLTQKFMITWHLKAFVAYACIGFFMPCYGADSNGEDRSQLTNRKMQLEAELRKITETLRKLDFSESSTSSQAADEATHFIEAFGIYDVNSAGGVEPSIHLVNSNTKSAIKYLRVALQPYDRVGQPIRSTIGNQGVQWVRYTGPLNNGEKLVEARWDPVWYNHSAKCVRITSIEIEFMNGSRQNFEGKAVSRALKRGLDNSCPPDAPWFHELPPK